MEHYPCHHHLIENTFTSEQYTPKKENNMNNETIKVLVSLGYRRILDLEKFKKPIGYGVYVVTKEGDEIVFRNQFVIDEGGEAVSRNIKHIIEKDFTIDSIKDIEHMIFNNGCERNYRFDFLTDADLTMLNLKR